MITDSQFQAQNCGGLIYYTAATIQTVHGFSTRHGGVSCGDLATLNLGENRGDDPANVKENYARLCKALKVPLENLVVTKQVHEHTVRICTKADRHILGAPVPYTADGLLTNEPMLPLMIYTADCIPVLLHDPIANVVGAVHAGWRGTVQDIVGTAVQKMASCFGSKPADVHAAIGPGIGFCCFETGDEVPDAVRAVLGAAAAAAFLKRRGEKWLVDLKGVNRALLLRQELLPAHIAVSPDCTMCKSDLFWSHRKTQGRRGAQASVIMLKGNDNR